MDIRDAIRSLQVIRGALPADHAPPSSAPNDVQRRISRYRADERSGALSPDAQVAIADALRAIASDLSPAAVVYAWSSLVETIHEVLWRDRFAHFNQFLQTRRKPRTRDSIRDILDADLLETCREAGLLNGASHSVLSSMLRERNLAGHVGAASQFTPDFALGFIERVLVQSDRIRSQTYPPAP